MKLTNETIYSYGTSLMTIFDENFNIYIPAKANFFIQKNRNIVIEAAKEIDFARMKIIQHYSELIPETQEYRVNPENTEQVVTELQELFAIEQDLNIKTFKIEDLGNTEFTPSQMSAIMFMIDEA